MHGTRQSKRGSRYSKRGSLVSIPIFTIIPYAQSISVGELLDQVDSGELSLAKLISQFSDRGGFSPTPGDGIRTPLPVSSCVVANYFEKVRA